MSSDERDTARPQPVIRVPVAKMALQAPRIPGDPVPLPEKYYQAKKATQPAPASPLPKSEVDPDPPARGKGAHLAALARWAGPRFVALVLSAGAGGVAVPRITGNVGRVEAHDVELAQAQAELRSLRTRLATVETERRTDNAVRDRQMAFLIKVLRERGTEIRIEKDAVFPALPAIEIQIPTDPHKPAQVATPFPTE